MPRARIASYAGLLLRVDLSAGTIVREPLEEGVLRKWLGGSVLGARLLYDEVPASVGWDDPLNRLIFTTGPLTGTRAMGSTATSVVTVGPMTGGAAVSQTNGYLSTYMKFSGFDGVIVQGAAERWCYLYIHDGTAELRDASHLVGVDTWELKDAICEELGKKERGISVFGIGPAGERLVRFAGILGDRGHAAAHNGTGAAMGSKRLKAIVAERGPRFQVPDEERAAGAAQRLLEGVLEDPGGREAYQWGTSRLTPKSERIGQLPVKNYTTSVFPAAGEFNGEKFRLAFPSRGDNCYGCRSDHLHIMTVPDGPYAGFTGKEPHYELWAAWGGQIGNEDVAAALVLANEVDRLGLENSEAGWVVGWVMECYERGILSKEELGGLEMTWGNVEAVRALLRKIAFREGIGDLLAEGVKRASERLGRGSEEMAVYSMKGNSPRDHDDRARWLEMLDCCISDTGSIEAIPPFPLPAGFDGFDPKEVSELVGRNSGRMMFEDSLGMCRYCIRTDLSRVVEAVAAATGWDLTEREAIEVGRRGMAVLRAFNLKRGLGPELEYPSKRYGSTPVDGPAAGRSVTPVWEEMRANYYRMMGWDAATGRPLPEILIALGLPEIARELWAEATTASS